MELHLKLDLCEQDFEKIDKIIKKLEEEREQFDVMRHLETTPVPISDLIN